MRFYEPEYSPTTNLFVLYMFCLSGTLGSGSL